MPRILLYTYLVSIALAKGPSSGASFSFNINVRRTTGIQCESLLKKFSLALANFTPRLGLRRLLIPQHQRTTDNWCPIRKSPQEIFIFQSYVLYLYHLDPRWTATISGPFALQGTSNIKRSMFDTRISILIDVVTRNGCITPMFCEARGEYEGEFPRQSRDCNKGSIVLACKWCLPWGAHP